MGNRPSLLCSALMQRHAESLEVISYRGVLFLVAVVAISILSACLSTYVVRTEFYMKRDSFSDPSDFQSQMTPILASLNVNCMDPHLQNVFLRCAASGEPVDIFLRQDHSFFIVQVQTSSSAPGLVPNTPSFHFEYAGKVQKLLDRLPVDFIERNIGGKAVRIQDAGAAP